MHKASRWADGKRAKTTVSPMNGKRLYWGVDLRGSERVSRHSMPVLYPTSTFQREDIFFPRFFSTPMCFFLLPPFPPRLSEQTSLLACYNVMVFIFPIENEPFWRHIREQHESATEHTGTMPLNCNTLVFDQGWIAPECQRTNAGQWLIKNTPIFSPDLFMQYACGGIFE